MKIVCLLWFSIGIAASSSAFGESTKFDCENDMIVFGPYVEEARNLCPAEVTGVNLAGEVVTRKLVRSHLNEGYVGCAYTIEQAENLLNPDLFCIKVSVVPDVLDLKADAQRRKEDKARRRQEWLKLGCDKFHQRNPYSMPSYCH